MFLQIDKCMISSYLLYVAISDVTAYIYDIDLARVEKPNSDTCRADLDETEAHLHDGNFPAKCALSPQKQESVLRDNSPPLFNS